jgi:Transposase domain (DUF772)
MIFEGIRSERKLIETASLQLAHRWYLGYALDEALPDHSSLTRIRQRLGIDIFQRFFDQIVDLCQEAGLVWGRELYVDATKVEANADLDSLSPRFYHEAKTHVANLFVDDPAAVDKPEEEGGDPPPSDGLLRLSTHEGQAEGSTRQERPPRRNRLEERRLDPTRLAVVATGARPTSGSVSLTRTPPRCAPGTGLALGTTITTSWMGAEPASSSPHVTPAEVRESLPALDLLWRVCFRWKLRPK